MNAQKSKKRRPIEDSLLIAVLSITALYVLFLLGKSPAKTIPEESRGIMFTRFDGGLKVDKVYGPGFHLVAPWNNMILYDISIQQEVSIIDAISNDGASVSIEVQYSFNPLADKIGHLHNEIGPAYAESIIELEIREVALEVIKKYNRTDLNISKKIIENSILSQSKSIIETKYIQLRDLQLISISHEV